MARAAVTHHIGVIKDGGYPSGRVMAVVALIAGRNVCCCFASRLHAIVAREAVAGKGRVVHEINRIPGRGDVTVGTTGGRHDVIYGFRRRPNDAAGRMAAGTDGLCRSERRAGVATLTSYADVRAVQYESGTKVIKRLVDGTGDLRQQAAKQD
jgi:hypothetical protein